MQREQRSQQLVPTLLAQGGWKEAGEQHGCPRQTDGAGCVAGCLRDRLGSGEVRGQQRVVRQQDKSAVDQGWEWEVVPRVELK